MNLGPNAVLPHGTDSRRRSHLAHGELCPECMPDEAPTQCDACWETVRVVAGRVVAHVPEGWDEACWGSGLPVWMPSEQPVLGRHFQLTKASVGAGR